MNHSWGSYILFLSELGTNINNGHQHKPAWITCASSQARDLPNRATPTAMDETPLPAILWASVSAAAGKEDLQNMWIVCRQRVKPIILVGHQWKCWQLASCFNGTIEFKREWGSEKVRGRLNVSAGPLSALMTSSLQVNGWFYTYFWVVDRQPRSVFKVYVYVCSQSRCLLSFECM